MNLSNSRRGFIKKIAVIGVFSQLPIWYACESNAVNLSFKILTNKDAQLLLAICNILFPNFDKINIEKLNTLPYLDFVLNDDNYDADEKNYILDGINSTNSLANELYNKDFIKLSSKEKAILIYQISQKNWGNYWLSKLLTLIFESLLLDPIYQVNPNKIGWNWLKHPYGIPQPNYSNNYQQLLEKKNKTRVYTSLSQL